MPLPLREGHERRHLLRCIVILSAVIGAISPPGHALQSQPSQSSEAIPPLIEALWSQDFEKVKQLLADGADPQLRTSSEQGRRRGA